MLKMKPSFTFPTKSHTNANEPNVQEPSANEPSANEQLTDEEIIKIYIDQLSENEKKGLEIAKDHLESSFSLEKSIGFLKFKKNIN